MRRLHRRAAPAALFALLACDGGDVRSALDADELAHDTIHVAPPADDTSPAVVPVSPCGVAEPDVGAGQRVVHVTFTCRGEYLSVPRVVQDTPAVLLRALQELLRGPIGPERDAGFHSFFSDETAGSVRSVVVDADGVARIDFTDFSTVIPNASSSAGSADLLAQLRLTIFQYPTIREARLSFDGSCDAFWNWLQRDCQALVQPARRTS